MEVVGESRVGLVLGLGWGRDQSKRERVGLQVVGARRRGMVMRRWGAGGTRG